MEPPETVVFLSMLDDFVPDVSMLEKSFDFRCHEKTCVSKRINNVCFIDLTSLLCAVLVVWGLVPLNKSIRTDIGNCAKTLIQKVRPSYFAKQLH